MLRILGVLISGGTVLLLYVEFSDGLAAEMLRLLSGLDLAALVLAISLILVNFLSAGLRYRLLLQRMMPVAPSLVHILQMNLWSLLMAHAAPLGGAADVARIAYQRTALKMSTRLAVQSVICDRILAVVTMAAAGLAFLPLQVAHQVPLRLCLIQTALWGAIIIGSLLAWILADRIAKRATGRASAIAAEVGRMYAVVGTLPRLIAQLGLGVIYCLSFGLVPWVLLRAAGSDVDPLLFLAISPALLFAQSFPLSYVGWGVREWAVMLLAGGVSDMGEGALVSASVGTGLVLFLCSLPGIFFWLRMLRK